MSERKRTEFMWVVGHPKHGLYYGSWLRRRDAVAEHCRLSSLTWETCRKRGDFVTRALITYWEPTT